MKLFSTASCYNPLSIIASGKQRELQRIFIFDNNGVILQTGGWFTNGFGSNSAKKEVVFNYDNDIKLKRSLDLTSDKVFAIKTTYEYTTYQYGNYAFTVDLYIHNDVAKFELDKYIVAYDSIRAVYKSYAGVQIERVVEQLDVKSRKLQSKIWNTKKEIQAAYQNDVYQKLGSKLARQCRAWTKTKEEEAKRTELAKVYFGIVK